MKRFTIAMLFLSLSTVMFAKDKTPSPILPQSTICINVDGNLNSFIAAEIMKQRLPLQVMLPDVKECTTASFTLQGETAVNGTSASAVTGFTGTKGKSHTEFAGAITIVNNSNHALVWGFTVGNGKFSQVAEKLVKQMKKELF